VPFTVARRIHFKDERCCRGTDETVFWLELLSDTGIVSAGKLELLLKEANELLAICAASLRTAKHHKGA